MRISHRKHESGRTAASTRRQSGTVLLLAMLVLSSMIIAAAGLGTLILDSLQQTRAVDSAVLAYSAAESGIEQGIYLARCRNSWDPRCTGELPSDESDQALANSSAWSRTSADWEPMLYMELPQDGLVEIALFDPKHPLDDTSIDQVEITWRQPETGETPILRATMVSWPTGGGAAWAVQGNTPTVLSTVVDYTRTSSPADFPLAHPGQPSRLRLRVEQAPLRGVQVRLFSSTGQQLPIPARVRIEANGDFLGVRQKLTARMPRLMPLSGVFDFVMFSQCSLVKGIALNCQ